MKASKHKPYGNLIPLDIPDCPWQVVEIDFITNIFSSTLQRYINIFNTLHNLISYIKLFNVNHIIKLYVNT